MNAHILLSFCFLVVVIPFYFGISERAPLDFIRMCHMHRHTHSTHAHITYMTGVWVVVKSTYMSNSSQWIAFNSLLSISFFCTFFHFARSIFSSLVIFFAVLFSGLRFFCSISLFLFEISLYSFCMCWHLILNI